MSYQLEIDTHLWCEGNEWSEVCIKKDGVTVVDIKNWKWPELLICPQSNVIAHILRRFDLVDRKTRKMDEELKDDTELGVVIYLDEKMIEVYRKGIGFFRITSNGGLLFQGYRNQSDEIFFEKITKRSNEVPLNEVKKEVIVMANSIGKNETDIRISLPQEVEKACNDMISNSDNYEQKVQREAIAMRIYKLLQDKYELSPKDIALKDSVDEFKRDMKRIVSECMSPETPKLILYDTASFWEQTLLQNLDIRIKNNKDGLRMENEKLEVWKLSVEEKRQLKNTILKLIESATGKNSHMVGSARIEIVPSLVELLVKYFN